MANAFKSGNQELYNNNLNDGTVEQRDVGHNITSLYFQVCNEFSIMHLLRSRGAGVERRRGREDIRGEETDLLTVFTLQLKKP